MEDGNKRKKNRGEKLEKKFWTSMLARNISAFRIRGIPMLLRTCRPVLNRIPARC